MNSILTTWDPSPEPDFLAYELERRPAGGEWRTIARIENRAETSHTGRDAEKGVAYEYRVRQVTGRGESEWCPVVRLSSR
ncbi:MAG: hypothetical protein C3F10_07150 [Dehalococcoidia bacterium]|nr:fibronectin type III domain-containing protein [Dehalococcoidia bacterium]PWB44979.1 MAG: hypothetical protein C3F10_07150 [Dehalococcoidia bacterium]